MSVFAAFLARTFRFRTEYGEKEYLSIFSQNAGKYGPEQGSTITIISLHVITYVYQNFGVRDVLGEIPKNRHHTFYLVIFLTIFPKLVLT